MPVQLLLPFEDVPVTCETQSRYHAIAPCLAGQVAPRQQAQLLNLSYSTVSRWLKQFRDEGMRGLIPAADYLQRQPYTPERIIVSLIYCFRTLVKAMQFHCKNLLCFLFLIQKEKIKQISFAFDS